jgi:hypothetical protein
LAVKDEAAAGAGAGAAAALVVVGAAAGAAAADAEEEDDGAGTTFRRCKSTCSGSSDWSEPSSPCVSPFVLVPTSVIPSATALLLLLLLLQGELMLFDLLSLCALVLVM